MKFCWHKWKWEGVRQNHKGAYFQPGYCPKCGKAKIRWIR